MGLASWPERFEIFSLLSGFFHLHILYFHVMIQERREARTKKPISSAPMPVGKSMQRDMLVSCKEWPTM